MADDSHSADSQADSGTKPEPKSSLPDNDVANPGSKLRMGGHRSSSPGIAHRVQPPEPASTDIENVLDDNKQKSSASDEVIDDMSQKLADCLLDNPSNRPPKAEYVSINQKLAEKKQEELAAQNATNDSQLSGLRLDDIPSVHSSSSLSQLGNDTSSNTDDVQLLLPSAPRNGSIAHDTLTNGSMLNNLLDSTSASSNLSMDVGALNITRSTNGTNLPRSANTSWENSNGGPAGGTLEMGEVRGSQEVDILTAMSGEPAPNTLPLVADGLSDGEVSSESDVNEEDDEINNLNNAQQSHRVGRSSGRHSDSFYAHHESIMKSKTAEEVAAVKAAILDIKSAVSNCAPIGSSSLEASGQVQSASTDASPIWEIRESYAVTLKLQEAKRKQRMEMERRYEQEYRDRQLQEIVQLEAEDNRVPAPQTLDEDDPVEQLNTDYYSSEDDEGGMGADTNRSAGWGAHTKYSRLGNADGYERSTASAAHQSYAQTSNAGRLAEHEMATSPVDSKRHRVSRDARLSNSSYSSSSQSSVAPSTVRCKMHRPPSPESDSSSANSWDYGDEESPVNILPSGGSSRRDRGDYDTDEETDRLIDKPYQGEGRVELPADTQELGNQAMKNKAKEVTVYDPDEPTVLIEGILFRAAYLGSTQLMSEAQPSKAIRMMQAQEAVGRIKAPDGENQPSTDVDLFVSTEKVMVLNTDLQEIMMDHALRSISYIADIDSILVVMAKRSLVMASSPGDEQASELPANAQQKLICHIFETDEAHLIAQSIGQAFQVAYMEFLKANGIDDPNLHLKDASYEDILEQQEIMNDELETFTRKDKQKDIIVPKSKGESLGIVIVESGWGSVLPTVVLANMSPTGAAARCGLLNIGDQIISVNGISLVGLPLSTCQEQVKAVKNLTAVRLCVVSRPPVVEVLIKRPDRKYQLGFSVQNGVICSLLRGGIAERGGIRVGHRIIEINGLSVVAVAHEKIVHTLSTSIGEIHMKTMPMAVFRLLTGQEIPQYI